jgi:hypothetical protein
MLVNNMRTSVARLLGVIEVSGEFGGGGGGGGGRVGG